jgi:hypothetical protein
MLSWILEKYNREAWTGLIWLNVEVQHLTYQERRQQQISTSSAPKQNFWEGQIAYFSFIQHRLHRK